MTSPELNYWRKCTTCKKLIGFRQKYWVCSVSTCNRIRTDLVFCDLKCFDAHVPVMNHRDAGAFERTSPSTASTPGTPSIPHSPNAPKPAPSPTLAPTSSKAPEDEILVVVSKVKAYIRTRAGMNTSDSVMDILSEKMRAYADRAIESAQRSGRKTVLDRDLI